MLSYADLLNRITTQFSHQPTRQQRIAMEMLAEWCCRPIDHKVFLLKGFAGTGKTTVISALSAAIQQIGIRIQLLAPTGRAAKVLANYSNRNAYSIHKVIYRQNNIASAQFSLNYNAHRDTLFIIDEASMIANHCGDSVFGSGRLLDDLIEFIYSADNCSAVFLGDTAQLLPIGSDKSPALDADMMQGYGLEVTHYELTEVLRQAQESGILYNATLLRQALTRTPFVFAKFDGCFKDMVRVSGEDLIDQINSSYGSVGEENTIILTYSNKRATLYNRGVRNQVMMREDELNAGDYLMVTKNNYTVAEEYKGLDFIANGDIAEVIRVSHRHEAYGFRFADATLRLLDYEIEVTARICIDSLYAEAADTQRFYQQTASSYAAEHPELTNQKDFWTALRKNEHYNALQVKFAYAVTCHKAQGGQWDHVYIDQGYITEDMLTPGYCQWLYTAVTRARKKVFLVNFADYFFS